MVNDLEKVHGAPDPVLFVKFWEKPLTEEHICRDSIKEGPSEDLVKGGGNEKLSESLIREMKKWPKCFRIEQSCISQSPAKGSSVISRTKEERV